MSSLIWSLLFPFLFLKGVFFPVLPMHPWSTFHCGYSVQVGYIPNEFKWKKKKKHGSHVHRAKVDLFFCSIWNNDFLALKNLEYLHIYNLYVYVINFRKFQQHSDLSQGKNFHDCVCEVCVHVCVYREVPKSQKYRPLYIISSRIMVWTVKKCYLYFQILWTLYR